MSIEETKVPAKKTVLLVEDDRVVADLVTLTLGRAGLNVKCTNNPEDVFRLVDEIHPTLILLDLFLPGCNGLDLLEKMKVDGKLDDLPVIIISAYGFMEVLQQAILMGAKDFIVKPFNTDLLMMKVDRWTSGVLKKRKEFSNRYDY
jgi:DNA-binding NtrC family response regulator